MKPKKVDFGEGIQAIIESTGSTTNSLRDKLNKENEIQNKYLDG